MPEDDRNIYTCSDKPKHLSQAIDKFDYALPYNYLVGGVLAIRPEQFRLTNGYSNLYWGWGAEDDDFYFRIINKDLAIERSISLYARYKMIRHEHQKVNEKRFELLNNVASKFMSDGLNSLKTKCINVSFFKTFTHFLIDIGDM